MLTKAEMFGDAFDPPKRATPLAACNCPPVEPASNLFTSLPVDPELVSNLIRRMSRENPLWGELLKLGIEIGETSVVKYTIRHRALCGGQMPPTWPLR